jgi:hypothetical protein
MWWLMGRMELGWEDFMTTRVTSLTRPADGLVDGLVDGRAPYILSAGLALAATISGGLSLLAPDLVGGVAVSKGNLRGTSLVVVVAAVPTLLVATWWTAKGSARALVAWLGAVVYLIYQAVMFCFATPLNSLFYAYVAHLGLGIWTVIWLLSRTDVRAFAGRLDPGLPVRRLAAISMAVTGAFAWIWLARSAPAVFSSEPTTALEGTGLLTNPLWVQDLAVWFPAGFLAGVWMWRRRPLGVLLTAGFLIYDVIEALSIASDQWWGARADGRYPDVASMSAVPLFLVLAVLTAMPVAWLLHHIGQTRARIW